ncbi:Opacity-associated protein A [Erwinia sp. E602]|nr:Opacity-associated protein A [Erwinia sp. E602]
MGQIARRKRKSPPLAASWLKISTIKNSLTARFSRQKENDMPGAFRALRAPEWLIRLWHLPDRISWMDPLPLPHRRGIIIAVLVILLAFLWPSAAPQRAVETPLQNGSAPREVPLQATIEGDLNAPVTAQRDTQGQWNSYTISSGQTLAQLFRDNNLPVNDVFSMAQVEGADRPLSTLRSGQQVKIRQNAQGVVNGLTLQGASGEILFTRQPDGSFIRAQ